MTFAYSTFARSVIFRSIQKLLNFSSVVNEYLWNHGKVRSWFSWIVRDKGGIIEMFEKSKIIDISFKTMEIGDENLLSLNERMKELGMIIELFSPFCSWNDLQILQSYESIDVRVKKNYRDIMRKLNSRFQFWIMLNIAQRFAEVKNFCKLWILSVLEFL